MLFATLAGLTVVANGLSKAFSSAEIDSLWDYDQPKATRAKFIQALKDHPESKDEIRTQIARTWGLENKFKEGWKQLQQIPSKNTAIVRVRVQLESGRLTNSSGNPTGSIPYFKRALNLATAAKLDFYSVDAAHMLGIVTKDQASLDWNEKAIQMARHSVDKRAQGWQGSLLNNTAWTYHDMGKYEKALKLFQDALAFREKGTNAEATRIARWSVARCLRSLKRYDEALAIQRELEKLPQDGYVWEEIAEILYAQGKPDEAKSFFHKAYEVLSKDEWLVKNEPKRLKRLKELGG